jgi:hypothetical protein
VFLQFLTDDLWKNHVPILLAFGVPDQNVIPGEVHILYPQSQSLQKPETRSIEQTRHQRGTSD